MQGRNPSGVLVVQTNCNNPTREEDFNRWYNHTHLGQVTAPGVLSNPTRYRNVNPNPGPDDAQYLAIYETQREDVEAAYQEYLQDRERRFKQGMIHPNLQRVLSGMFRRIGQEFSTGPEKRVTGAQLVFTNCNDPTREQEFNDWYNDTHIPDVLDTGCFHTAYRYQSLEPQETGAKYLALYETDWDDPWQARQETAEKHRPGWIQRGRYSELMDVVRVDVFKSIWP